MASQKQIEANRKNALKSTGAITPEGKAIVRFNAVTHGLTSEAAVIPFVENPEDWEAHRAGIIESLSPVGHLETILTERIAMLIWRLGRANRYERELAAIEQERIEEKHFEYNSEYKSLESMQRAVVRYKALRRLMERLPNLGENQRIPLLDAVEIVEMVADVAEKEIDLDESQLPGIPEDIPYHEFDEWTANILCEAIKSISEYDEKTFEGLLDSTHFKATYEEAKTKLQLEKASIEVDRKRRKNLLPNTDILDKLYRYESQLERSLYKAMHEIERLQATRKGQPVPLPVEVEVTVNNP